MAENNKAHWAKQLYFYVVLAVTTVIMASSLYSFVHVNMTKLAMKDLHNEQKYQEYPRHYISDVFNEDSVEAQEDEEMSDLYYQKTVLQAVLTFAVAALVLFLNVRMINPGDTINYKK